MLKLRKLKHNSELLKCIDIAIEVSKPYAVFPVDLNHSKKVIRSYLQEYLRIIEKEEEMVGFISAIPFEPFPYSSKVVLTTTFYQVNLKGYLAAKALVMAMDNLFKYAESKRYEAVMTSSVLPNCKSYQRILIKHGWTLHCNNLVRKTRHYR